MIDEKGPLCFVDIHWSGEMYHEDVHGTDKNDAMQMSVDIIATGIKSDAGFPIVRARGKLEDLKKWIVDVYSGGDQHEGKQIFKAIKYLN